MSEKCPLCGAPMQDGVCSYCGYMEHTENENLESPPPDPGRRDVPPVPPPPFSQMDHGSGQTPPFPVCSRKKKWFALLLCLFFGWIGAHRFYVGKVGTGLVYLITGGLFGIGWIVDLVMIAVGVFRDEFGLPLRE